MTHATDPMTDPSPLHRRAMAQTESIVAAVFPAQLTLPTPRSPAACRKS